MTFFITFIIGYFMAAALFLTDIAWKVLVVLFVAWLVFKLVKFVVAIGF